MTKYIFVFCFIFFSSFKLSTQVSHEKPKLIVGIIVDQMRQEYLYRYYDKFGEGGFKRLMNQGFVTKNTHYNYVPTKTAPGHASVYTGSTPRYHGIISNSWYHRNEKEVLDNVTDPSVKTVGSTSSRGEKSPFKLKGTTITDELQIFSNGRSKVISMSLKDRGAILPGGHLANGAYWYDGETGDFVTSTYYMEELPDWVERFNKTKKVDSLMNLGWNTLLPIAEYVESDSDDQPYEKGFPIKDKPVFPYDLKKLPKKDKYDLLMRTPHGNTILRQLAEDALSSEALGQRGTTDFLAISFSSTDVVGHAFGPQSIEVEDTYLRLDHEIAHLLATLDKTVGKDQYTLFLTADHAGADTPQFLNQSKVPMGMYSNSKIVEKLNAKLVETFQAQNLIVNYSNQQVYLDRELIKSKKLDMKEITDVLVSELYDVKGVAQVYTGADLRRFNFSEKLGALVQLGYNNQRSGDVAVVYEPIYWAAPMSQGTTHGSAYNYDTNVPLLWFGANIPKGETVQRYSITDIAPTISVMLNIKFPSESIGNPISELFKEH